MVCPTVHPMENQIAYKIYENIVCYYYNYYVSLKNSLSIMPDT